MTPTATMPSQPSEEPMSEETTAGVPAIAGASELFGRPSVRRFKSLDPLPVKGVVCRIRSLTEREVSDYQTQVVSSSGTGMKKDKLRSASRRLISKCLVNDAGQPFVSGKHLAEMAEWDYADIGFLYEECAKHVGLNTDDIENLVKNSEETHVED
jgi:hypothetical protein